MSGFSMVVALVAVIVYCLPLVVAIMRGSKVGPVMVINLLLGWTIIGWIAALVLAVWPKPESPVWVTMPYDGSTYHKGRVVVPGDLPPTPEIPISTEISEGGKQSA